MGKDRGGGMAMLDAKLGSKEFAGWARVSCPGQHERRTMD